MAGCCLLCCCLSFREQETLSSNSGFSGLSLLAIDQSSQKSQSAESRRVVLNRCPEKEREGDRNPPFWLDF